MADQLQIQSLVTKEGTLELSLATIPVPKPADGRSQGIHGEVANKSNCPHLAGSAVEHFF